MAGPKLSRYTWPRQMKHLRHILVILLVLAQAPLGARGGGFVCLGPIGQPDAAVENGACRCDHGPGEDPGPRPVKPHEHEDCPCIDVAAPVGRVDHDRSTGDLMRDSTLLVLLPVSIDNGEAPLPGPPADGRPPGSEPGFLTTRLLL